MEMVRAKMTLAPVATEFWAAGVSTRSGPTYQTQIADDQGTRERLRPASSPAKIDAALAAVSADGPLTQTPADPVEG